MYRNKHLFRIAGFTLMEVLVALIILSIAFTSIFMAISSNVKNIIYLENKTAANYVGHNTLAAFQLGLIPLIKGQSTYSETSVMFNKAWDWIATIEKSKNPYIYALTVNVKPHLKNNNIIQIRGYILNDATNL